MVYMAATWRRGLLSVGAIVALIATMAPPTPLMAAAEAPPLDQRQIASYLDNAAWVPDGPANQKHIYIVGAPWCPFCQALYRKSRSLVGKLQFRWIMAGSHDAASAAQNEELATMRDPSFLNHIYLQGASAQSRPPTAKLVADWNDGVAREIEATAASLGAAGGQRTSSGFPTICRKSASNGQWNCHAGLLDVTTILSDVAPRPEAKDVIPAATLIQSKIKSERTISSTAMYARYAGVVVYAAPDKSSPVRGILDKDDGYHRGVDMIAATQDGEQWACFSLNATGGAKFCFWVPLSDLYTN